MRTIETKVYTFSELSERAKERAREWFRSTVYSDSSDWDCVLEDACTVAGLIGIEIDSRTWTNSHGFKGNEPKIYFSGFCSQGDGAIFEGSYSYKKGALAALAEYCPNDETVKRITAGLQELQKRGFYGYRATISRSGRYVHANALRATVEDRNGNEVNADIEGSFIEYFRDFANWIYSSLQSDYEYKTSKEGVDELLDGGFYEFYENGEVI